MMGRFDETRPSQRGCRLWAVALAAFLLALASARAEDPATPAASAAPEIDPAVTAEVDQRIAELDHADFATRRAAAARLEELAAEPRWQPFLAGRFRRALLSEETSFEVRSHLEPLARALPKPPTAGDAALQGAGAIAPLIAQLNDDSYARRDSAVRRLTAMLQNEDLVVPVWLALKERAAAADVSASERQLLEPLVDRAHEAWLLSDKEVSLPKPSEQQIARWIDDVMNVDETQVVDLFERTPAERKLLDLIARDDTRDEVVTLLLEQIEANPDTAAAQKMRHLVDFARPGMAAEAWSGGRNVVVQYLILGVPQLNDAVVPPRATHFDHCDEQTAHCVTGNSLSEGNYPVGVGIPHPEAGRETFFFLTNLPTPRRRLAFEYYLKRDESWRLEQITERTLAYLLTRREPLSEVEVLMLAQLEPRRVSRWVGNYFQAVPNGNLVSTPNGLNNQPSVYAGICLVLTRTGTHEAIPALEKLARDGTLGKPVYPNRVDIPWVAMLAIASRDEWPGIDAWLAGLIDEQVPLTTDPDLAPELGASAAGLLLDRHGVSVRPFGLTTAGESVTDAFNFVGYRFTSDRDREAVKRWWKKQQTIAAAAKKVKGPREQPMIMPLLEPPAN